MGNVIRREEMLSATLQFGGHAVPLSAYAMTGLRVMCIGGSGSGKTNAGLLIAEQLSQQGWVAVIVDPENELAGLYGGSVSDPEVLQALLCSRERPVIVLNCADGNEFVPFGEVIFEAADRYRKPIFVMVDEAQLFSRSRGRSSARGSTALLNEFGGRGRKRALDLFVTSLGFAGSVDRSLFNLKNMTLVSSQNDPLAWSSLAPQFRGTGVQFSDLSALGTGEFFLFSASGVDKVKIPLSSGLKPHALEVDAPVPGLPSTYAQWSAALDVIPREQLLALTPEVTSFLSVLAGLSPQQYASGQRALAEELECRHGG